jgi:hypothetical protein
MAYRLVDNDFPPHPNKNATSNTSDEAIFRNIVLAKLTNSNGGSGEENLRNIYIERKIEDSNCGPYEVGFNDQETMMDHFNRLDRYDRKRVECNNITGDVFFEIPMNCGRSKVINSKMFQTVLMREIITLDTNVKIPVIIAVCEEGDYQADGSSFRANFQALPSLSSSSSSSSLQNNNYDPFETSQ